MISMVTQYFFNLEINPYFLYYSKSGLGADIFKVLKIYWMA